MDIDDVSAGATNGAAMLSLGAETIAGAKHHYSCYRSAEKTFIQFEASSSFSRYLFLCVFLCILEFEALLPTDLTPAPCPLT